MNGKIQRTRRLPLSAGYEPRPQAEIERFWRLVDRSSNSGACWEWQGARSRSTGYGSFTAEWPAVADAHRYAYAITYGPIPEGRELDHLCRNRGCVNPQHLEAVSHRENCLRGAGPSAENAKKTHCPHGHPYSIENTYLCKGARQCKTCALQRAHARGAK